MGRPNILYLHVHDMGRYCQPYGFAVPTPNIQKLAERGVLFRQAFCACPTCSPSRAALLTGQSPHNCGMDGLAHRGFRLYDYDHHVAKTLSDAGYHTALLGTQHVHNDPTQYRYDERISVEGGRAIETALPGWFAARPDKPFFLSVGYGTTHREYDPPGPAEDARYLRPPLPIPDTPETRRDMAAYTASARITDVQFGRVLAMLDAAGLTGQTLVICTTDHGIAFPHMKCNLLDHGIGVMLILAGPGGFSGGKVLDAMVSQIDVFPTLCELLEIAPPPWLQGRSLMPLIRGEAEEVNDAIFTEVTYHAAYEPMRSVRTRRWKYIRRYDGRTTAVMPNCDDSITKDLLLAHGWRERRIAAEQLYDLIFDPNEACNLAGEAARADVVAEMRGRLDEWMRQTDDPLLKGPVPAQPGARVNDPDGLSPKEQTAQASS